jgi:hypothetical protein
MANRISSVALATTVASGYRPDQSAALGTAKHLWIHVKPYTLFVGVSLCVSSPIAPPLSTLTTVKIVSERR